MVILILYAECINTSSIDLPKYTFCTAQKTINLSLFSFFKQENIRIPPEQKKKKKMRTITGNFYQFDNKSSRREIRSFFALKIINQFERDHENTIQTHSEPHSYP